MEQAFTKVFEIDAGKTQADQGMINLKRVKGQLKEVTLTVKKPMFEQKIDRMVINVKNSVTNAGGYGPGRAGEVTGGDRKQAE